MQTPIARLVPILLLTYVAAAPAIEISCPRSILEAPSVSADLPDWQIVASVGERPLEQAGVYLGDPSERGAQVPDATRKKKAYETVTWQLVHSKDDAFWIGCSYGGTTAMLFRKLDPTLKQCQATYDLLPSGRRLHLKAISCR
jgi:hypothetical protein